MVTDSNKLSEVVCRLSREVVILTAGGATVLLVLVTYFGLPSVQHLHLNVNGVSSVNNPSHSSDVEGIRQAWKEYTSKFVGNQDQRPSSRDVNKPVKSSSTPTRPLRDAWESQPYRPKPLPKRRPQRYEARTRLRYDPPPCRGRCRSYPHFMIIGARKCGTGALRVFLKLHPALVTPKREEIRYFRFGRRFNQGDKDYYERMPLSTKDQLTFEKSIYFDPEHNAVIRLRQFCETYQRTMKFILLVREPVTRMISDFARLYEEENHGASEEEKRETLVNILVDKESNKLNVSNLKYFGESMYYQEMKRWLRLFPLKDFLILDGEAFAKNPVPHLRKIEDFLGLNHVLSDDIFYYDKDKGFYCFRKDGKSDCLSGRKGRPHTKLPRSLIDRLLTYFKPLNKKFFDLVGVNFDWSDAEEKLRTESV